MLSCGQFFRAARMVGSPFEKSGASHERSYRKGCETISLTPNLAPYCYSLFVEEPFTGWQVRKTKANGEACIGG